MLVWRLGRLPSPWQMAPRNRCNWLGRFDDPRHQFRTLYCGDRAITCIRECLQELRPNVQALDDFANLFGSSPHAHSGLVLAGTVEASWRQSKGLAQLDIDISQGPLADLDDVAVRERLKREMRSFLAAQGVRHLDVAVIRRNDPQGRQITQAIAAHLYDHGYVGIKFGSNLDNFPCCAFFEGKVAVAPRRGRAIPMTQPHPDLVTVCGEYNLILRST